MHIRASIISKIFPGLYPRTPLNKGRVGRAGRGEEGMERLRMKEREKGDGEREVGRRGKKEW
jgi:hypothetical protein